MTKRAKAARKWTQRTNRRMNLPMNVSFSSRSDEVLVLVIEEEPVENRLRRRGRGRFFGLMVPISRAKPKGGFPLTLPEQPQHRLGLHQFARLIQVIIDDCV